MSAMKLTKAQIHALAWLPDDGSFRTRTIIVRRRRKTISFNAPALQTMESLRTKGLVISSDQITDIWAITPEGRRVRDAALQ